LLGDAAEKLSAVLADETILVETPVEVEAAIDSAVEAIQLEDPFPLPPALSPWEREIVVGAGHCVTVQ